MKNVHEPTYSFVVLTAVLIIINTVLAWLSVKIAPVYANGVSWLYFAVAFMIIFTLWFGAYGAIAAYVGTFLGSGLFSSGMLSGHLEITSIWAMAGLFQVLIPLVALRSFDVDLSLENRRDWTLLLLFAVLINNVVGAAWGAWTLALGNIIQTSQMASVFFAWLMGNIIVTILIVPPVIRHLTPKVQKSKFFVKYYWE
jgi:hypothetical protein